MSMKDNLKKLTKAIEALTGDEASSVEMTPEDFISYAAEQISMMKSDSSTVRVARIAALRSNVESLQKNFEGTPMIPGGLLSVVQFRDPGQVPTTSQEMNAGNATPADNFSSNGQQPGMNGAGSAPSQPLVPDSQTPGSGFESPAMATFAKAMEGLTLALSAINPESGDSKPSVAPSSDATQSADPSTVAKSGASEATPEAEKAEPVAKSGKTFWPSDMNTPFGLGETADPEIPEWGFDSDSSKKTVNNSAE